MGQRWSTSTPVEDPHGETLRQNKDLVPEAYPRSDGLTFKLSSGRTLGYAILGAVNAPPERTIVFFHGTPGTRFDFHQTHAELAKRANVRILIPERPGFGLSSPHPNRTLLSFADDVEELLAALELKQVIGLGYSGGGPFAMALAKRCPACLSKLVVVSSVSPVSMEEVSSLTEGMSGVNWMGYYIAKRVPFVLPYLVPFHARASMRMVFNPTREEYAEAENEIFRNDLGIRTQYAQSVMELYSRPCGAQAEEEDYRLIASDWGFELSELDKDLPVFAYAGENDDKTVPNMWRRITSQCPNVAESSRLQPNKGHLYFYELFPTILEDLGLHCESTS